MPHSELDKILDNHFLMIPLLLGAAAGAVVSIAAGFYLTFQAVVMIGAS
jgi:hypothetical protein